MKITTCLTIICLLSYGSLASKDIGCRDKYVWCPFQKYLCDLNLMKDMCKETCGICSKLKENYDEDCVSLGCANGCDYDRDGEILGCHCPVGYQLNQDGRTCSDIDECAGSNVCEDPRYPICQNTAGSYACTGCMGLHKHTNYYKSNQCCLRSRRTGCGQNRLTGTNSPSGRDAILGLWPWTALIHVGRKSCTGVIISDRWILTAAHCLSSSQGDISVQVAVRSTAEDDNSQQINVNRVIVHGGYNFPANDVALLQLESRIHSSWAARPICLPNGETPSEGSRCWMSGFEMSYSFHGVERNLVDSGLFIRNKRDCSKSLSFNSNQTDYDKLVCGEFEQTRYETCPGEIGGPIVCQRCASCDWYVAGISSFGNSCSHYKQKSYAAYSNVEVFESWIAENTGININKNSQCSSPSKPSWRHWSEWSTCTQSCGTGQQVRSRVCRNGDVGQKGCKGNQRETQACNTGPCPQWGDYSQWSPCSVTCGRGTKSRSRLCENGSPGDFGCQGSYEEYKVCTAGTCSFWEEWSKWSECGETCGESIKRISRRKCVGGNVGEGGCMGTTIRYRNCNLAPCPSWTPWSSWSSCSRSCGGGTAVARRTCSNKVGCDGSKTRRKLCNTQPCIQDLGRRFIKDCDDHEDRYSFCSHYTKWCKSKSLPTMNRWCAKTCCRARAV